jgi:hypothetical protein
MTNGALLRAAEAEFEAFVTVDRNMQFQQNARKFRIPVFILCAESNRLVDILPLSKTLVSELEVATPGQIIEIRK